MHIANAHRCWDKFTNTTRRRYHHPPTNPHPGPATCSEGNAAPRTRPKCSIKLIVAVMGTPCNDPCHAPTIENQGLSIGKKIAIRYPIAYPTAEYVITDQYPRQSLR